MLLLLLPLYSTHVEMAWDVHESQIRRTDELHWRSLEETIVLLADESGILNGFVCHGADIGVGTNDADVLLLFRLGVGGH